MNETLLVIFFIFVTLSQALFLQVAKRKKNYEFKKKFWNLHYSFNGILWIILFGWIILIQFSKGKIEFSYSLKALGLLLFLTGAVLSFLSTKKLGLRQAMGYRFFTKKKLKWLSSGSYKILSNPIYDGFILIFLGLGFLTGITINFYLTIVSFLLLNVILACFENEKTEVNLSKLL